jgi:hypothetical protein
MITFNPGLSKVHGGMQFQVILTLGIVVVSPVLGDLPVLRQGFLIKRRRRNGAVQHSLGMEKKAYRPGAAARAEPDVAFLHGAWASALGILLGRLMFLLIRLAIRIDVPLVGSVNLPAVWLTLGLFAVLFLLLITL